MKRGTKTFVFITAMLLTVAGLKATIGHRYGFYRHHGACHNESMYERHGMKNCHRYNHDDSKPDDDMIPEHQNKN